MFQQNVVSVLSTLLSNIFHIGRTLCESQLCFGVNPGDLPGIMLESPLYFTPGQIISAWCLWWIRKQRRSVFCITIFTKKVFLLFLNKIFTRKKFVETFVVLMTFSFNLAYFTSGAIQPAKNISLICFLWVFFSTLKIIYIYINKVNTTVSHVCLSYISFYI